MGRIIWSPLALLRLKEIKVYISFNSPANASIFLERLIDYPEKLLIFSNIGRIVPEFNDPEVLEVLFEDYRIIFRKMVSNIEIITVFHGSKRPESLL